MRLLMLHRRRLRHARAAPYTERRALTHFRLDPNAPAMHLDNLSRNGEAQPRPTLGTGVRAVDLAELFEDPLALFRWDARAGIADAYRKVAIGCTGRDTYLASVREFDRIADGTLRRYDPPRPLRPRDLGQICARGTRCRAHGRS